MKYEIWFMDEEDVLVGEAEIEADGLVDALAQIVARTHIHIPGDAVMLSMQVKP